MERRTRSYPNAHKFAWKILKTQFENELSSTAAYAPDGHELKARELTFRGIGGDWQAAREAGIHESQLVFALAELAAELVFVAAGGPSQFSDPTPTGLSAEDSNKQFWERNSAVLAIVDEYEKTIGSGPDVIVEEEEDQHDDYFEGRDDEFIRGEYNY